MNSQSTEDKSLVASLSWDCFFSHKTGASYIIQSASLKQKPTHSPTPKILVQIRRPVFWHIVYTFKILSSLFPISMHVNSWQLTCSVMRLIPGASALFPDTDLQVQFVSLKNISSHTTICLSFSLHLFLPIKFQKLWRQKKKRLCSLRTPTQGLGQEPVNHQHSETIHC